MLLRSRITASFALLVVAACGDDDGPPPSDAGAADAGTPDAAPPPDGGPGSGRYEADSRFTPGQDSVEYQGQIARQILLVGLVHEMEAISDGTLDGSLAPTAVDEPGEVVARLNAFFRAGTDDLSTLPLPELVDAPDVACQLTYEDLEPGTNLLAKVAGEDDVTDHRDWDGDEGGAPAFGGFTDASLLGGAPIATPVQLIDALFATFEAEVRACVLDAADCPVDAAGEPLPLYVTPDGLHLAELVEKTLIGALAFSQGSDDYLDDDVPGKGLLSDHVAASDEGPLFTSLEHAWDEAYGYFGAARNYTEYTDDEIRGEAGRPDWAHGHHDTDGDGCIDLYSERNFGAAIYAARRDAGATSGIDLTGTVFAALVAGRRRLASTPGPLDEAALDALRAERDTVVSTWERALGASAIHYINATLADLAACGTAGYSFAGHAGHFSEAKGFAIALQFSPDSPFSGTADFTALHEALGDQPVPCSGPVTEHQTALEGARDALRDAYGFDPADAEAW